MSLFQAVHVISDLCAKVGVRTKPRVSITFDSVTDLEIFKAEVAREFIKLSFTLTSPAFSEVIIYGIKVRIGK